MTHDFVVRVLKNSYRVYLENHFAAQKTKTHDDEKKKDLSLAHSQTHTVFNNVH
jgi:hypothetical protein